MSAVQHEPWMKDACVKCYEKIRWEAVSVTQGIIWMGHCACTDLLTRKFREVQDRMGIRE